MCYLCSVVLDLHKIGAVRLESLDVYAYRKSGFSFWCNNHYKKGGVASSAFPLKERQLSHELIASYCLFNKFEPYDGK